MKGLEFLEVFFFPYHVFSRALKVWVNTLHTQIPVIFDSCSQDSVPVQPNVVTVLPDNSCTSHVPGTLMGKRSKLGIDDCQSNANN